MIRLAQIPAAEISGGSGSSSENAAHRIAVEWDDVGAPRAAAFKFRGEILASRFNTSRAGRSSRACTITRDAIGWKRRRRSTSGS